MDKKKHKIEWVLRDSTPVVSNSTLEVWNKLFEEQNILMAKFVFHQDPSLRKEHFNYNVVNAYISSILGDDYFVVQEEDYCDASKPEFYDFYRLRSAYLCSKFQDLRTFAFSVAKHKATYGY